jgi:hypothetical protein
MMEWLPPIREAEGATLAKGEDSLDMNHMLKY